MALTDPLELLIDDSPGADVLVSDLGIAHDRLITREWKPDIGSAGSDEGARPVFLEGVCNRSFRGKHGIELGFFGMGILSPAISNDQNTGSR